MRDILIFISNIYQYNITSLSTYNYTTILFDFNYYANKHRFKIRFRVVSHLERLTNRDSMMKDICNRIVRAAGKAAVFEEQNERGVLYGRLW